MKRLPITLTVLSLAAISLLGVVSCQKEKTEEKPIVQQDPEAQRALERISEFKNKVKDHRNNSLARSSETISLEDALWNIENVFNATFSQPEIACSERAEFEFYLYLPVDVNHEVRMDDLLYLYDEVVDMARTAYINDGFINKVFRFMTVDMDEPCQGSVKLTFKGRTGERNESPWLHGQDTCMYLGPFLYGDNYDYDYGKCDGTGFSGADEMLTYHIGQYIASQMTMPPTGIRAIYLNSVELTLHGNDYPNDLFYRTNISATCIDFNNMNLLYGKEKKLITETLPGDPLSIVYGMTPIDFSVLATNSMNPEFIAHDNCVIYTWRVLANLNDIGEIEDLLD